MPLVGFTCPHCKNRVPIEMDVAAGSNPSGRRSRSSEITPLTQTVLSDILDVLRSLPADERLHTEAIYQRYLDRAELAGRKKPISKYAFVIGIKRYGCQPWRAKYERGYTIPADLADVPLRPSAAAEARRESQLQREAVQEHRSAPAAPFDPLSLIEMPDELPL